MNARIGCLLYLLVVPVALGACGPARADSGCPEAGRQLAISPPLKGTSDGGEGFPWRLLYGYCVAAPGRLHLWQDWVVSWLDATPQGAAPGGTGVAFGTDLNLQLPFGSGIPGAPYVEFGGGVQYASGTAFPAHGSRWMFTMNVGAGLRLGAGDGRQVNLALRYLHISNAGLLPENAGYDAFHLLLGWRW